MSLNWRVPLYERAATLPSVALAFEVLLLFGLAGRVCRLALAFGASVAPLAWPTDSRCLTSVFDLFCLRFCLFGLPA
jgi:hypothetical protein